MSSAKKWKIGFLVAGILIFAYMVYAIGLDNIWENVRKTGWWFLPIVLIWLVVYLINTLAWMSIVRDKRHAGDVPYPSFLKMLQWTISGYTINYITPVVALGGEPYRILELQEYVGTRRATSAVLSYSMMHILSHLVFWMCSIVLIIVWLQPAWGLTAGLVVMFVLFVMALYMVFRGYRKGLVAKTFRILEKIPFINKPIRRFSENRSQTFREIDANIIHLYTARRPVFFKALSLEFLARAVSCFELVFIAKAIGIDMDLLDAIVLYAGSTLFANIMFFSPMQLGTREGGLALTLKIMGFSAALGVYTGLVMRVRELCWIGFGLLLMRIERKNKDEGTKIKRIKGILIDYGGTIDTGGNHWFPVFRQIYVKQGVVVEEDMLRKAYVYAEQQLELHSALIHPSHTFKDILQQKINYQFDYLIKNNARIAADDKARLVEAAYGLARRNVQESAQALRLLAQQYPLVLVSNFYGNLPAVINDFGIADCFRTIIESAVVGVRKPDPEIFRLGIRHLGLLPEEVAVVGDSYKNDIAPAQLLGCRTVWLRGAGWNVEEENHPEHKADIVINQLSELQKIINHKLF